MSKKILINLWDNAFVFAIPTAIIVLSWLLSLGGFNLIATLNDEMFVTMNSIYIFFVFAGVCLKTLMDMENT